MNPQTGADLACASLVDEGVSVLFGHPGGAILPFYDALYRCARLRHVLCRHEQGAAHAADGYARATGRTGVCVATSGPGATNLVTGLATALMDSVPLVALTGQVARPVLGTYAFQETDILGVTMPVTKHGFLVDAVSDIPGVIAEAFELARSGRPGPVLVDLPKDVQAAPVRPGSAPVRIPPNGRASARGRAGRPDAAVGTVARWVSEAERPVVLAGRGVVVSRSTGALAELAARADVPVTTSLLGLDAFPASDSRAIGMPGMHGTERANQALQEADLVIGLGVRFDDRIIGDPTRFAPNARIAHFDIDATAIGRTMRVDLPVVGDLAHTLPMLARDVAPGRRPAWWTRLRMWERAADATPEPIAPDGPLGAREAIRGLARRIVETGALVASDVGQHQMWLAQELADMAPGTHLTSGGLGTMGYALPAGLGAAIGRADRPVWIVAGDGGFQMNVQELATVAQERVPVRMAVVDNGYLGMVRQWQERFYGGRYSAVRLTGPDLVGLGEAYGIPTRKIDRSEQLEAGLDRAVTSCGPVLLWLRVEAEENVYPMVPTGAALHEMVHGPEAPTP
jgi:acetolactate synthase-1/2/3 large subunit